MNTLYSSKIIVLNFTSPKITFAFKLFDLLPNSLNSICLSHLETMKCHCCTVSLLQTYNCNMQTGLSRFLNKWERGSPNFSTMSSRNKLFHPERVKRVHCLISRTEAEAPGCRAYNQFLKRFWHRKREGVGLLLNVDLWKFTSQKNIDAQRSFHQHTAVIQDWEASGFCYGEAGSP